MSSNSKLLDVSTERLHNSFITAILPNGVLHRAFLARHPFNAVFVPSEARLQDLGLSDLLSTPISEDEGSNNNNGNEVGGGDNDNSSLSSKELAELFISHIAIPNARLRTFLASLLDNHLARFDDFGLGEAFTLCNGIRGAVSDGLDKLSISGRLSRIPIASHTPPSNTKLSNNEELKNGNVMVGPFSSAALMEAGGKMTGGGSSASRLAHLNCLNIFFLADCVIESYDVKRVMLTTATNTSSSSATHRSSGPDQAHHQHLLGSSPLLRGSSSFGTHQNTEEEGHNVEDSTNGNAIPELQVSTKPARGISKILDGLMTSWRGGGGGVEETAAAPVKSASEYTDDGSSSQQQEQKDAATLSAQKLITPPPPQKSDPQANFKEFQSIMQKPESKHLTRCLTAFVDYCNNATCVSTTRTSSLGSNGSLGGGAVVAPPTIIPGASPANKPVSANEVRSVIDQLMKIIYTMQQNGEEGGKLWKGKEEEVALEGFEKYILTKIYNRTYAFYPKEREEGTALHLRIAALRSVVSEQTFEIVAPVKFKAKIDTATILSPTEMGKLVPREEVGLCSTTTHWTKAIEELRAMSTYKCPRDKLMCGINACRLVVKALDVVSLQVQQEKKRLQDLEKELRHDPPPAPRTLNPSSIGNSDEEENNNEEESDDSAKMAAPQQASADTFLPAMFLLVSRANPLGYLSSMRFVDRYRHRTFLNGDAGYLLTCLLSAIDFWQNCGHEELGITSEVFEKAMSTLPKEEDKTTAVLTATNGPHPTSSHQPKQQQSLPVSNTTPTPTTTTYTASPVVAAAVVPSASCLAGVDTALNCRIPSPLSSSNNNNSNNTKQQQHMDPFDAFFDGGGVVAAAAAPTRGNTTTTSNNTNDTVIAAAATVISTPATRPPREDSGSYRQQHEAYPEYDPSTANNQQQAPAHRSAYPPTPGQIASPVNHHQSTVVSAHPAAFGQSAVPPSLQSDHNNSGDALVKRAITKMNGVEGFDSLSVAELRALAEEALRLRQLLDLD